MRLLVLAPLACLLLISAGCSAARPERNTEPALPSAVRTDLHLHFSMEWAARPLFKGRTGDGRGLAGTPNTRLRNQIDADALHDAGVRLAMASLWPPFRVRPNVDAHGESVRQLALLERFVDRNPGLALATSSEQARALMAHGYVTVIPALEGGEGIRTVDDVDTLYAAGARMVTLVHFGANALGGAAYGQLPPGVPDQTRRSDEGLTELGRAVVERMMEVGMLIDLAHASDKLMDDVLALTEARGVPVLYSHTGARALKDGERNLSDEMAVRIAQGGGLLGVTAFDHYVAEVPKDAQLDPHAPDTCDDVVAHWRHLAALVGAQNVTLGSDFNGFITRPDAGGRCAEGLRHVGDLPALFSALVAAGIPAESIDSGGERLLKLWAQVEGAANPVVQAQAARRTVPEVKPLDGPL